MTALEKKSLNFVLLGFTFAVLETIYFGNNFFPSTKAEVLCDTIAISLSLYGLYLLKKTEKEGADDDRH